MTLPFEVPYSEKPSKQSKGMKRLAVIVKPEKVDSMISSLKRRVASGRGTGGTFELAYNSRKVVATVVKSDDVDAVVERMKNSLAGDKAVVMISQVDDLVMI